MQTQGGGWQRDAGKIGKSSPAAPDPVATASAQGTANTSTAASQAALNNVSQYSPLGSNTFAQNGSYTNSNGETVPTYSETTSLNPQTQNDLNWYLNQNTYANQLGSGQAQAGTSLLNELQPGTNQLAGTATQNANTPLNFNTADSGILNSSPQQINQQAANATYQQETSFLDPQWSQQQTQLQDQLSRQGIPLGSDAYNNAMQQFNNSKTQAYQSAQNQAIAGGSSAASNLFNMALGGQQQNISQQTLNQTQGLNLLQSLLGAQGVGGAAGGSQSPLQPTASPSQTGVSPTDVLGAQGLSTSTQEQNYQQQVAQQNAAAGAIGSLALAAILA